MTQNNLILTRNNQKSIIFDVFYAKKGIAKPLVLFCHGYKGFKDWGAWDLVANKFMQANCFFVKFNFSHNGGTMEQPIDFPDLEAFAENNYSKELKDLGDMIDHILSSEDYKNEIDVNNITLIGHSRGGGIVTIKASEDKRITKLITWAGVCDFGKRMGTNEERDIWKHDGVKYVMNGRTKQQMPHNYQFFEDFKSNEERFHIEKATKRIHIPHLIIQGTKDPAVSFSEAEALHIWNPKSELFPIPESDHIFGAKHPWKEDILPADLQLVTSKSIAFSKT